MFYNNYDFFGMHFIWWCIWIILLFWLFATPYAIPGQRSKKDTPLEILQKRFASGQITKEQYLKDKAVLESTKKLDWP